MNDPMKAQAHLRSIESPVRRDERASKRRQRELEKLMKEQAKLSEMERARLVVETFDNTLAVLLTVHRDASATVDWFAVYSKLPPFRRAGSEITDHEAQYSEWAKRHALARKVLDGESSGYIEALSNMSAFDELATLGDSVSFRVESHRLITSELRVSGREAIPAEVHSLTATGKLVTRPMPRSRFHEIYQDYVCSCVLRVGREVLALLPVDTVIVNAIVGRSQDTASEETDACILSVAMTRASLAQLDFERLDPSDAIETLPHRGDVIASKKSGKFSLTAPLHPEEICNASTVPSGVEPLWARVRDVRKRIQGALNAGKPANP